MAGVLAGGVEGATTLSEFRDAVLDADGGQARTMRMVGQVDGTAVHRHDRVAKSAPPRTRYLSRGYFASATTTGFDFDRANSSAKFSARSAYDRAARGA